MNEIQLSNNLKQIERKRTNLTKLKIELIEKYDCCQICKFDFKPILQIHHITPISNGGKNDVENLLVVCPNCHKIIHAIDGNFYDRYCDDKYIDDWMDNNVHPKIKQVYINYALKILKSRYPSELKEVIENDRNFK